MLIKAQCAGAASKRRTAVNATFAHNAVFVHPFFVVRGRGNVYWVYEGWSAVNRRKVTYDADISGARLHQQHTQLQSQGRAPNLLAQRMRDLRPLHQY